MHRLTPLIGLLALACVSSEPEAEPTLTVERDSQAAAVLEAYPIEEADYGDGMLAEGVAVAPEPTEVTETIEVDAASPVASVFSLRRGESLAHFARWSEQPVEDIAEISGLPLDGSYPVGTEVKIELGPEALAMFESLRESHQTRRVEGYLASRGGLVEEEVYKVRTGDSAWGIARSQGGMPVWLIESYNPDIDLERLRPGDQLVLPVLADVVVDAEVSMP